MISDAVMVALLRETILPRSPATKTAARILLEQIRRSHQIDVSGPTVEVVRADAGFEVAQEMEMLAAADLGNEDQLRH